MSIYSKKPLLDAQRGKVFTQHGHMLTMAARKGGDPSTNSALRLAIENARKDSVPNANIERAIKRGTGELKDGAEISEIAYEGYGPAGVAVIVECLTDNKNRTISNVRIIFDKFGGNMGNTGSVGWMFERKGVIRLASSGKTKDEWEMVALETGADDVKWADQEVRIITMPQELFKVVESLRAQGLEPEKSELSMLPKNFQSVDDPARAKEVLKFLETFEEDMDVTRVHHNAQIPEGVMKQIEV